MPSLRRLQGPSSPARIPDWKRDEGKALSQAHGLVPSLRHDTMILLSQPVPGGEDSSIRLASSSTTHSTTRPSCFHGRKRCQCNPRYVVGDVVEYVLFAMPTTACSYAIYLFKVPSRPTSSVPPVLRQQGCLFSQPQFLLVL